MNFTSQVRDSRSGSGLSHEVPDLRERCRVGCRHSEEAAMDKVVHFEIPVDDRARANAFYSLVFDWDLMDNDMGGGIVYTSIRTVATEGLPTA